MVFLHIAIICFSGHSPPCHAMPVFYRSLSCHAIPCYFFRHMWPPVLVDSLESIDADFEDITESQKEESPLLTSGDSVDN